MTRRRACAEEGEVTSPDPRLSPGANGATLPEAVENPDGISERECPVCLGVMALEERSGVAWLVCPNGCPTETEAPQRKLADTAAHKTAAA